MSERLRQGLQLRNKREKGDRPLKGKDQAEREELSPTRSRREDHSKRTQVAKRIVRQRPKPHPKEKAPSSKNNLLTRGRAEQADLQPGEHNGENQEPPKTRSFSEDHPVRGRQRLQGASRATDRGTKPQQAESRAGYPRQPHTRSKGHGGNTEPQHGTVMNTGGS